MRYLITTALATALVAPALTTPAFAADKRELGSHEHGVGILNIAFEGNQVAIELEAPGADIVGFEHEAKSAEDKAKIDDAIAVLGKPLSLFVLPGAAGCTVAEAKAALLTEDDEHGHDDHAEAKDDHGHGHDDHAEAKDDHGHGHDDHAEAKDDHGHGHDDHAEAKDDHGHDHDDHAEAKDDHGHGHDHDDHADEASHSEFRAQYALTCTDPAAIETIDFAYFEQFPNALELEVQLISDKGTQGFEVERDAPSLSLAGAI